MYNNALYTAKYLKPEFFNTFPQNIITPEEDQTQNESNCIRVFGIFMWTTLL